jgi:hypothetical protein
MPHELQFTEEDRSARLDDYLDRVVAPLVDDVPHARRRELRAELGAHLEALVDAHVELGANPEEALAAAIRQFGPPRQVGKHWLREWRRERPAPPASALQTARVGLLCFLTASFFSWAFCSAAVKVGSSAVGGLLLLNTILFPTVAGLLTGILSRTRHGYGALLGCGCAALICAILGAFESVSEFSEIQRFPVAALAATQMVLWLPLAALAGAAGGSLRRGLREALGRWATE